MNLLLDTHALLWWLFDDPALSPLARDAISDRSNSVFVSSTLGLGDRNQVAYWAATRG